MSNQAPKKKRWLSGLRGWDSAGNVIETYWVGDPAIDQDKSDLERYKEELEKEALVVKEGEEPELLRITLPEGPQLAELQEAARAGIENAAALAFALSVRFPDLEKPKDPEEEPAYEPEYRGKSLRLPMDFLSALLRQPGGPHMVQSIGMWVFNKVFLSDQEKKASSPESTAKTS